MTIKHIRLSLIALLLLFALSCGQKGIEDLTPERISNIVKLWFSEENKENAKIHIEQIIRTSEYSHTVVLNVQNFKYKRNDKYTTVKDTKGTAFFIYHNGWTMVKFGIGDPMHHIWRNMKIKE